MSEALEEDDLEILYYLLFLNDLEKEEGEEEE